MKDVNQPDVCTFGDYEESEGLGKGLTIDTDFDRVNELSVRVPYPMTLYEGPRVAGLVLPDGTLIEAAKSTVGQTFFDADENRECEVVWDGASKQLLLGDHEQTSRLWEDLAAGRSWAVPARDSKPEAA